MVEQVPIGDDPWKKLDLVLYHQPARKSYGFRNTLIRKQAYHWRHRIATSLMGKPTDLNCWRYTSEEWPPQWKRMIEHPLRTAIASLTKFSWRLAKSMVEAGMFPRPSAVFNNPIHHFLICLKTWLMQTSRKKIPSHRAP